MIEPIDFSGNDNEYLSSELKQQVLAFSILWAIVGFAISAWIFLGKKVGPTSLILDRRQAEGRVVEMSSRGRSSGQVSYGFAASAPRVRPYMAPTRDKERWTNLARLEPLPKSAASAPSPGRVTPPKPVEPVKVVAKAGTNASQASVARPRPLPPPEKKPEQVARENPGRLLYPVLEGRPERSNMSAVARRVERSLIRMVDLQGLHHIGLVLDRSGKALISDAFLGDGSIHRVTVNGTLVRAELLHHDAEYGLALLQLPPGSYGEPIPLAPGPPARGEELLAFTPTSSRCLPTAARAGVGFAQAGFLLEGNLGVATWGTPLFNSRGELVGCQFRSLPDFPGSGVHLAADSAAVYRIMRGYDATTPGAYESTMREACSRLTSLAGESSDKDGAKKGRILAKVGVSQFFIGMSTEQAKSWVSSPTKSAHQFGLEVWRSPAPPLELVFINDRLVAVATDFSGFSTVTGLSMGARIDSSTLRRSFEHFMLVDGLALTPGLDILLDAQGKARQFVVRPEL